MPTFNIIIERGEDGFLVGEALGLPGCRSQARTHDELIARMKEAIRLYLEATGVDERFIGVEQVEI